MRTGFINSNLAFYPLDNKGFSSPQKTKKYTEQKLGDANLLVKETSNIALFNSILVNKSSQIVDLERYARSDLRCCAQVEKILERCPKSSRYMGSVPYSWLENIPKEKISKTTDKIFELFSDFAKDTTCSRHEHPSNYRKQIEECASMLGGIIGKETKMSYLSEGTIGRTYKLSVDNEDFVVKTFFTDPVNLGYYTKHGKGAEILSAVYAKHNVEKGNFADFYFGKFARKDDIDGFMVTKFINKDNAKTSYVRNMLLEKITEQPLICGNTVNNMVLDTVVDYGEVRKGCLDNKYQYEIQRLLTQAILAEDTDRFNEICSNFKGSDLDKVLGFLTKSYTNLTRYDYSDVEILGEDEIKIVTSDSYYRIFKLIFFALNDCNYKLYDEILSQYKETKELEYVLNIYNKEMSEEERQNFARRIRKTELEKLKKMFTALGLV